MGITPKRFVNVHGACILLNNKTRYVFKSASNGKTATVSVTVALFK